MKVEYVDNQIIISFDSYIMGELVLYYSIDNESHTGTKILKATLDDEEIDPNSCLFKFKIED